jgi:hypothetical protein
MFHSLIGVAGLLGLVALAFGDRAAVMVARSIILLALAAVVLLAVDIMLRGALSRNLL